MKELIGKYIITFPVGPIVSNSDGLTPVTDLTLSGADEKAIRKHGTLTPVSISANSWAAIESMDGHYNLTLTNSNMDTYGPMRVTVQDDSKCLPYFEDVVVVTSAYWNSKYNTNDWALASMLPSSETLNAHIITLPTSGELNDHIVTLPNSEVLNTHIGTLPVSGYMPSSSMVADLPNSQTLNAHIITLPTSEIVGTIADKALSDINLDHLMKTVVTDSSDLTNEIPDFTALALLMAAGGNMSAFVSSDDSLQGISEGVAGGGASASEVQSACYDAFDGTLPNSQTLNTHIVTLPTSQTLNAHMITLPTSEVLNAHIVTLPLSGSLPSSGTLKDLINTLPNSQVLNAHMITLPTSLTLKAHIGTLPTSLTLEAQISTLPASGSLPSSSGLADLIATLPTSLTLQAHIVTLPTSQTLNAHAITLPTSQTVMNAISSMDVRVSSLFYTEIESGYPFIEKQRIDMAVFDGVTTGGGTSELHFRNVGDTKSRLIVTVDSDGNRTAVNTLDGS